MILVMIYPDKTFHSVTLTCPDYMLEAATIIMEEPPLLAWAILDRDNAVITSSEEQ